MSAIIAQKCKELSELCPDNAILREEEFYRIHRGAFGDVTIKEIGEHHFAVKVMRLDSDEKRCERLINEIDIIKKVSGVESLRLITSPDEDVCFSDKRVVLIKLRLFDGNLHTYNFTEKFEGRMTAIWMIKTFKDLVESLNELHNRRILHRDIKPHNILHNRGFEIVLSGYGLAVEVSAQDAKDLKILDSCVGTEGFIAPESMRSTNGSTRSMVNDNTQYSIKSDIYSMGISVSNLLKKWKEEVIDKNQDTLADMNGQFNSVVYTTLNRMTIQMTDNDEGKRLGHVELRKLLLSTIKEILENINDDTQLQKYSKEEITEVREAYKNFMIRFFMHIKKRLHLNSENSDYLTIKNARELISKNWIFIDNMDSSILDTLPTYIKEAIGSEEYQNRKKLDSDAIREVVSEPTNQSEASTIFLI